LKLSPDSGLIDTAFAYFAQIITILAGVAVQSCLAWFLGPSDRGSYAVCLVFGYIVGILSCFGIDGALQYYTASKKIDLSQIMSMTILLSLFSSILGLSIGVGLLNLDLEFFQKASTNSFLITLLYIPVSILDAVFTKLLIGLKEFKSISIFAFVKGSLNFIGLIILVYFLSLGIDGALYAIIIAWAITVAVQFIYMFQKYHFHLGVPLKRNILEILHYGRRFYFTRLGNIMNSQIGTVILAFFLTSAEIGYYAVATKLVAYVIIIPDGLGNALLPRVAASADGKIDLIMRCSRLSGSICGMILILLLVFIKPLIVILFSSSFLPVIPIVWILIPGILIRCITKILISYFNGINRPEIPSLATITGVTANLTSLLLFLPFMGLQGGAVAMSCGYLVNASVLLSRFSKFTKISFFSFWGLKKSDLAFLKKTIGL
jgi:O-antigen/teichoic acid export membrane protein